MNHFNHKFVFKLMLPLFFLLAACGSPTDRKTEITPTPQGSTVFVSPTSTASPVVSTVILEVASMPVPSSTPTLIPTVTATTTSTEVVPTETAVLMPTQANTEAPSNDEQDAATLPSSNQDNENPADNMQNSEGAPGVDQSNQPPLVIIDVIIPPPGEPNTKLTPTPCFICTAE